MSVTKRPDPPSASQRQPESRAWFVGLLRESFGLSFWLFAAFALSSALLCYLFLGAEVFRSAVAEDVQLLSGTLPRVAAAQVVAGFAWVLLPRDRYFRLVGTDGERRGLIVATAAGIITPGGPAAAFSLLAIMAGAGADRGVLIAYITSWALLAWIGNYVFITPL